MRSQHLQNILNRLFLSETKTQSQYSALLHLHVTYLPSSTGIISGNSKVTVLVYLEISSGWTIFFKAKLAKLRRELIAPSGGGGGGPGIGFDVARSGQATVTVIGFPSVVRGWLYAERTIPHKYFAGQIDIYVKAHVSQWLRVNLCECSWLSTAELTPRQHLMNSLHWPLFPDKWLTMEPEYRFSTFLVRICLSLRLQSRSLNNRSFISRYHRGCQGR